MRSTARGERYLGLKIDREKHAVQLRDALGGLKGPLMKVAQLLSTIPEALPREYAQELAQLQADAPPMGWPFVKRRMASELGPDWQSPAGWCLTVIPFTLPTPTCMKYSASTRKTAAQKS